MKRNPVEVEQPKQADRRTYKSTYEDSTVYGSDGYFDVDFGKYLYRLRVHSAGESKKWIPFGHSTVLPVVSRAMSWRASTSLLERRRCCVVAAVGFAARP